jgi:hypothetical protein
MKRTNFSFYTIIIALFLLGCNGVGTYYEQLCQDKLISERISDLNKPIDQIRKEEKGELINEGLTKLKYEYAIGDNDRYIITYLFDDKGCYEISFDGYFAKETDAQNVVDGIKGEMKLTIFGEPEEANNLCRWKNPDKSIWTELDYKDTSRGILVLTIQANE